MTDSIYSYDYNSDPSEESPRAKTQAAIVTIGGQKWLLGMRWRSYEVMPERADLAREAAAVGAEWVARRSGDEAVQIGFCKQTFSGWPTKVCSLAALLADSHRVPWAGAFDLGDGRYWYIAVRDNYGMMPDGDVIGTYEDIQRARAMHAALEDFNHVDGTRESLEELIARSAGKRTSVESLVAKRFTPKQILSVSVAALIVVGSLGGYTYYQHVKTQNRIALAKLMLPNNHTPAAGAPQADVAAKLRALPDPDVWLVACSQSMYSVPPFDRGWKQLQQECKGNQDLITWKRSAEGTIAYTPPGAISEDGNTVNGTLSLPIPANAMRSEKFLTIEQERYEFILWAQEHDITVHFDAVQGTPATTPPGAPPAASGAPIQPVVRTIAVQFKVPAAPFALDFSGIDGFRLTDVLPTNAVATTPKGSGNDGVTGGADDVATNAASDTSWTIEGTLYGR